MFLKRLHIGVMKVIKSYFLFFLIINLFFSGFSQAQDVSTLNYLKETKLYQKATAGDVKSMYKLGLIYYYGDGKHYFYSSEDGKDLPIVNFREAFYWFKKAAAKGHLDSLFHYALLNLEEAYGDFHLEELGATDEEGLSALRTAAEGGHTLAMYELFRFYMKQGDKEKGLYWEQRAAKAGHVPSQYSFYIGAFYSEEEDQQKEAVDWFLDFVYENRGKFGAYVMGHIAEAYLQGIGGLSQNPLKAYAWQSLFVKYYPACNDSESFRQELLLEYEKGLSPDEKKEALNLAKDLQRDIESRSQTRLQRLDFNCAD